MPAIFASAPAKAILVGEHAVVYGQPAIAIPLLDTKTKVTIQALPLHPEGTILIKSDSINLDGSIEDLEVSHPLRTTINCVLEELQLKRSPSCRITISSEIPLKAGLGSSASISVVLIKAFSNFLGKNFNLNEISNLVFEIEKMYHNKPSGIDNTVITFEKPVYFQKGKEISFLNPGKTMTFLIADTGKKRNTSKAVSFLHQKWIQDHKYIESRIAEIGKIVREAKLFFEDGNLNGVGLLMNKNQEILTELELSSPELENLIHTANKEGALGAKLTGGGLGGNIIALVDSGKENNISTALIDAGACQVYSTLVE